MKHCVDCRYSESDNCKADGVKAKLGFAIGFSFFMVNFINSDFSS